MILDMLLSIVGVIFFSFMIHANLRSAVKYIMAALDKLPDRVYFNLELQNAGMSVGWALVSTALLTWFLP